MAQGDARKGKWRGNWRMEWVASTLHTTSEHRASSITTADAHTSAVSSRLNWRPRRFKWTRPFRRKTKSGFCMCAITFQTQSTNRAHGERPLTVSALSPSLAPRPVCRTPPSASYRATSHKVSTQRKWAQIMKSCKSSRDVRAKRCHIRGRKTRTIC
jgi:hypothetical protein